MHQARFSRHQTGGQHHVQGPPDRSRASRGFARRLGRPPVLWTDPRPARRRPRPPRRPQTKRTATVGSPRGRTRRGTPGRSGYLTYPGTSRLPDAPRRSRLCPNATATRPDCSRGRALPDPEVHRHSSGTFCPARWWKLLRPKRGGTPRRRCRDVGTALSPRNSDYLRSTVRERRPVSRMSFAVRAIIVYRVTLSPPPQGNWYGPTPRPSPGWM